MNATLQELISTECTQATVATVDCKIVGTIDGEFSLVERDATEFTQACAIPVSIVGLLKTLRDAGMSLRGGGAFPYGGLATITGTFRQDPDKEGRLCLVDYETIEIAVYRNSPIRVAKSLPQ
jgi:hypothetical protein